MAQKNKPQKVQKELLRILFQMIIKNNLKMKINLKKLINL